MTVPEFALFLLVGRLLIWLIQTNGLSKRFWGLHPLLTELGECDLCLGFWVFLVMAILASEPMLIIWPPWLDYPVQAAIGTFAAHLARLGWHSKFGVTVI